MQTSPSVIEPNRSRSALLRLNEATDPARAGHKAASLADLRRRGFDVPDGFVVPVGAVPTREELATALKQLGDVPVAVRSSGVDEDSSDVSFAGQFDTVLSVRGADAVLEAVRHCVKSAEHERTLNYGGSSSRMAVLVQPMIDARAAGVAFSANPLTGKREEVRVSATRGLGDKLVSGELDADEWSVEGGVPSAIAEPQQCLVPDLVLRIAELSRQCEAARGAPQDIEWALEGERLVLLQSRPITTLPVPPQIEIPNGTWQKDAAHYPEPVSPFAASTHLADQGQFFAPLATWGALPDGVIAGIIGHEFYTHVEPDDGGKAPPPWWVIGIAARLVPSLRRKLKAAERAIATGLLHSVPADWATTGRATQRGRIEAFAALGLTVLDDDALFAHLAELTAFSVESMKLHFHLFVPYAVGVHELVQACQGLLNWDTCRAMRLVQGLSSPSAAPTHELAAIAQLVRDRPAARAVVEARGADVVERLEQVDPSIANELKRYLRFWGLRPFAEDAGSACIAERPELVAGLLADLVENDVQPDLTGPRLAATAEAREKLSGPALTRFDAALAYAEVVYAVREDNVLLTSQLPAGLLRRVALEAGRRLVGLGCLRRKEDAGLLTAGELEAAVRGQQDVKALVARRKAEQAWVRAHPGPALYGPAPGELPDVRGLPTPARRINAALLWILGQELALPANRAEDGTRLTGIAASPGVYRGRVRVVRTASHLGELRSGEVLVCPVTTAAWMMVFQRAGALVTDAGSALSHTAIVAREYGLPAVVATTHATSHLRDGEEVIVDGNRGTVERVGPADDPKPTLVASFHSS